MGTPSDDLPDCSRSARSPKGPTWRSPRAPSRRPSRAPSSRASPRSCWKGANEVGRPPPHGRRPCGGDRPTSFALLQLVELRQDLLVVGDAAAVGLGEADDALAVDQIEDAATAPVVVVEGVVGLADLAVGPEVG